MRKLPLSFVLILLFFSVAFATRGLIISEQTCTDISSPETGLTWCFDSTNGVMKRWNGTSWVTVTFTTTPIPPSQGGTGVDTSASNGLPTVNGGSWLVNTIVNGAYAKGGPNNTMTFQTTPIPVGDGGTGQGSFATGYIKSASGVLSAVTPVGTIDGGTGQNWSASNGIPLLTGGVASLQTTTNGNYLKGGAGNTIINQTTPIPIGDGGSGLATWTAGAYVKGNGASAPTFQTTPIPATDLGTGTPNTGTFLRGDNTWKAPILTIGLVGSSSGSNYQTTSTTFVDVDSSNLKTTQTTTANSTIVVWVKYSFVSSTTANADVALLVDGAAQTQFQHINNGTANPTGIFVRYTVFSGLSAGSHSFSLGWRAVDGVTLNMANQSTASPDVSDNSATVNSTRPEIIIQIIG